MTRTSLLKLKTVVSEGALQSVLGLATFLVACTLSIST